MNLIKQLCGRTFLLRQGEVICEGNTPEVINYYFQCSGNKEGITLLGEGDVELIFNNGRLFAFWQKRSITPDPGIYLALEKDSH